MGGLNNAIQAPMGTQKTNQRPQTKQTTNNQYIVHLKVLAQQIISQFKKQGDDVAIFMKQMKNMSVRRGQNFEGKVNENGAIDGIAKYFNKNNNQCTMFFGTCINGLPTGRGINIKANIIGKNDKVDKQNYEAQLLEQWLPSSEGSQMGSRIKKVGKDTYYFRGELKKKQLNVGKMIVKQHDNVKLEYTGQFRNGNFDGSGALIVPGKYKYQGSFLRNNKDGMGEQYDEVRKTYYVGLFENNIRHGYGQLTYLNRDNVKLMGFWTQGIIKSGQGVYVSKDGAYLQSIGDDIQLI